MEAGKSRAESRLLCATFQHLKKYNDVYFWATNIFLAIAKFCKKIELDFFGALILLKYFSDTLSKESLCLALFDIYIIDDESMAEIFLETLRQAKSFNDQKAAAIFVVWITKGLVLNWCRMTSLYIQYAVELLYDSVVGTLIAAKFEQLTTDSYLFSKESNCIVKLMYKQRFAQYVLPLLINKFETADDLQKANLIIAISSTLQSMPKQFLQKYLTAVSFPGLRLVVSN